MSKLKQLLFSLNETDRRVIEEKLKEKDQKIDQLKQQLAEKQNTIDEINKEFVQAVHDWKALCAEKDTRIAELEEQNNRLIDTLKEKDKENEELKLKLDIRAMSLQNINTERMESEQNQTQLAIQELAEVERLLYESHYKEIDNRYYAEYEDIKNLIDSRIQALEELKGEKDVKD